MLTNESIKIWYPKIQALLQKHKMYGYNDPGGAELIHPQFGNVVYLLGMMKMIIGL